MLPFPPARYVEGASVAPSSWALVSNDRWGDGRGPEASSTGASKAARCASKAVVVIAEDIVAGDAT